jgi:FAD/FMN-containing dehydrogenase
VTGTRTDDRQTTTPASARERALARMIEIVGTAHALHDPDAQSPYLHELRGLYTGKTPLVLQPASTREVAEILAIANEARIGVVPQGGNTGLVGGQTPSADGSEVVLSLSRLDRVRAVDAQGGTMIVEAGVTLAAAQEAAARVDRLFPLSLASEASCQIGGTLATNAGGTGVLAYGNARTLTLGVEVVTADG